MKRNTTISSWIALLVAILCWAGVGYFLVLVLAMQSEHAKYADDVAAASLQEGQAAQLRALARDTEDERAVLAGATDVDLLTAVNQIESINASGTPVRVINAQPVKSNAKNAAQSINIVDLSIHAEGPFSSVLRIAQMLETLPLTTNVQELNLTHTSTDRAAKESANLWSLNMRLRLFTTAALSS